MIHNEIKRQILECDFFAWQVDETTDITCNSQLSILVRYVLGNNVHERFLGFKNVSASRTANALFDVLDNSMSEYSYEEKLVAQAYDGAAVMSSEVNGLQSKIKAVAPKALFIYCYAHRLNLVLNRGLDHLTAIKTFFAHLGSLGSYFSKSTKRTNILNELNVPRIPSNCQTRWNFKSRIINTVHSNRELLIEVFSRIINDPIFDNDSISGADNLRNHLKNFNFNFYLRCFKNIFFSSDILFCVLQKMSLDVGYCVGQVEKFKKDIENMRTEEKFMNIYNEIKMFCDLPASRGRGQQIETHETALKKIYFSALDSILAQIDSRFADLSKLVFVKLLNIEKFSIFTKNFPTDGIESLVKNLYCSIFDIEQLQNELKEIYSDSKYYGDCKSILNLLLFFNNSGLNRVFSEVTKLIKLSLTIPYSTSHTESSFSTLKRIKFYTRNCISDERLSGLAMISINKDLVTEMQITHDWYDKIIDKFSNMENRRIELKYKIVN